MTILTVMSGKERKEKKIRHQPVYRLTAAQARDNEGLNKGSRKIS